MKKYLWLLFLIPYATYAADMCVKNDTVMVVLDPLITGTNGTSDTSTKTWTGVFSYGTIHGIAGCGTESLDPGQIPVDQASITTTSIGSKCFCKMLRPAVSKWVAIRCGNCTNAGQCGDKGSCVGSCKSAMLQSDAPSVSSRQALFGSVGTQ